MSTRARTKDDAESVESTAPAEKAAPATAPAAEAPAAERVLLGGPIESTAIFDVANKATGPDMQEEVQVQLNQHYGTNLPGDKIKVTRAKAEQLFLSGYARAV